MTTNDPALVNMSPMAVTLNEASVSSGIGSGLVMKERKLLNNPNLWHKVIVSNSFLPIVNYCYKFLFNYRFIIVNT